MATEDSPKQVLASLRKARAQIDEGFLVAIFAEGQLSHTGFVGPFHAGLETLVRKTSHPIIPVHLGGLWGSIFSHRDGPAGWRKPGRVPYPVTVSIGAPLPPSTPAWQVREAVLDLEADRMTEFAAAAPSLRVALLRSCRQHADRIAIQAADGSAVTYRELGRAVRNGSPPSGNSWMVGIGSALIQGLGESVPSLDGAIQAAAEALAQSCRLGKGRVVVVEASLASRAAQVAGGWAPLLSGSTVAEPGGSNAPWLTVTDRPDAGGNILQVGESWFCPPPDRDDGETRMGLVNDAWGGVATLNVPNLTIERRHQDGRRPGSFGLPVPGLRARIVEDGEVQPPGRPGRLEFRGAQIAGDPAVWLDTGIRATRDEAGFLYPVDRPKGTTP